MSYNLELSLTFRLNSSFHITGERAELWTDKALLLDPRGNHAVIPATTIKGWLRESIERWLRGLKISVCDSSRAETMCTRCLVCQLFGHPYQRSPLRFSDVVLEDELRDIRMNVSLSRYRRASYEERLFSTELAWHPEFTCRVVGLFPELQLAEQAAALIVIGAHCGFAIGASRSRGLGWVCLAQHECKVNGTTVDNNRLTNITAELIRTKQGAIS